MTETNSHGDKLLRLREVASRLQISVSTVRSMLRTGRLRGVVIGGTSIRVRESAVLAVIRDLEPEPLRDGDVIHVGRAA